MGKKRPGRPKKPPGTTKARYLQVRIEDAEKAGFNAAAERAGLPLSAWVRERLRSVARTELKQYGEEPEFLRKKRPTE